MFPLFLLAGCNQDDGTGKVLRYDLTTGTSSIDPQFSTSDTAEIIIKNSFEGLYQYDADGNLQYNVAIHHTLSEDKLEYTFTLRQDSYWSNGEQVTAKDFAYALKRMFNLEALSPFANRFVSIENAAEILNGNLSHNQLGVWAVDDFTLRIRLEAPNPFFLTLLAGNSAMPCNEKFLIAAKGRYGLDLKSVLFNGPFYVRDWNNDLSINLRKNKYYVSEKPTVATGVNFYIGREDIKEQFLQGKSDGIFWDVGSMELIPKEATVDSFPSTTWAIVFNQNLPAFSQEEVRLALAAAIDRSKAEQLTKESYSYNGNLIPQLIKIGNQSYRQLAGDLSYQTYQNIDLQNTLKTGLDAIGAKRLPKTTLLLPDNDMGKRTAQDLQEAWGKKLSFFVNLSFLPEAELKSAVGKGNYQIALYPMVAKNDSPITQLLEFSTDNVDNVVGFSDTEFDRLVYEAMHSKSSSTSAVLVKTAEQLLIDKAVTVPLFFSNSYFITNVGVTDIEVSPFDQTCHFKYAKRID